MIEIDIFADIACPWCYIGERRLERALAQRPELQVERRWRPFQLQPSFPRGGKPWDELVETKFGGQAQARAMFEQVASVGAQEGLIFDFSRIANAPNTLDAHRLVLLAGVMGSEWKLVSALFAAYFTQGRNLNDLEQLVEIAGGAGLDPALVRDYLAGEDGVTQVQQSQASAEEIGIQGVPFYIFNSRYAVSGAQPVEIFLRALDTASSAQASERGG